MKFYITSVLIGILAFATAGQANNATVENALKSRADLSTFYAELQKNGILGELKDGQPYTVFAPTNDAFARIDPNKYSCFYSGQCKAKVVQVLRKHIVPGEKHLRDAEDKGGIYSLFSIDNQHIVGAQPHKDNFTVENSKVLSEEQLLGGVLYKLNDVMLTQKDMVELQTPTVVLIHEPGTDLPPRVPPGRVVTVTTTDATTPIPH